jgi:D-sedoheptulose 7-phosphate isomerase
MIAPAPPEPDPGRPGRGNIAVRPQKLKGCEKSRAIKVYIRRRIERALHALRTIQPLDTCWVARSGRTRVDQAGEAAIRDHLVRSQEAFTRAVNNPGFAASILAAAQAIRRALANGGKLLIAGNGGSAADAQHIAAELVGRYKRERAAMPAIALTTDTSALTAIGNDYGFEAIFARQVQALGHPGDVLMAISTSGRSPNILRALDAARDGKLTTIGLTGETGADFARHCDITVAAPSAETALIQQLHIAAGHAMCDYLERDR